MAGAIVTLYDAANKDIAEISADAQGRYALADVKPGAYSLAVTWIFKNQSDAPCDGVDMTADGWFVLIGVQKDGGFLLVATGAEQKFDVAAGDVVQRDIDLKCP
jgi:hypothetical protein